MGYENWTFISKYQKGIVSNVSNTNIGCQPHELINITNEKASATGCKKCIYSIKKPISTLAELHAEFKNHVVGLLFSFFTESYDIITDILFTILLYNRGEM